MPHKDLEVRKAYSRQYHKKNRWRFLSCFRHHKITPEQKRAWYMRLGRKCGICGRPMKLSESVIDHCHKTGRLRTLAHTACNLIIGWAKDKPSTLDLAADFLRREGYKG